MVLFLTQILPIEKWVIINTTSGIALGTDDGTTVTYNGQTYPVTNVVTEGMELGIIGNSIQPSMTVGIHLHLYAFRDIDIAIRDHNAIQNDYSPMSILNFGQRTNFDCSIQTHAINYGANDESRSYFKGRASMIGGGNDATYTNVLMDVDRVDLFLKPKYKSTEACGNWGTVNSSYQLYQGQYVESKMNLGGINTSPSPLYPETPSSHNITTAPVGDESITGIDPYAYRDSGAHPWDDYYFSDFFPRIRIDHQIGQNLLLAPHNLLARYPDGEYEAFLRVETVTNAMFSSPTAVVFNIDNFAPFVKKVELSQFPPSVILYSREWIDGGNLLYLEPDPNVSLSWADCEVHVYTSEAMKEITLGLNTFSERKVTANNDEKTEWVFNVPASSMQNNSVNKLKIDGFDLNNNPMQKNALSLPIRQNSTTFSPALNSGSDENHSFKVGIVPVDFEVELLGDENNLVKFTAITPHTVTVYNWNFGDGRSSLEQNPEHKYDYSGVYQVTLTINTTEPATHTISKSVIVIPLIYPVARYIYVPSSSDNKGTLVDFFDDSEGIISEYFWDFGNGLISTEKNPTGISFDGDGSTVTLSVANAVGSNEYSKELNFDPLTAPWITIWDFQETWFIRNLEVSVSNLEPPYTFEIEFGDGMSEIIADDYSYQIFTHQYYQAGDFLVKAYVTGTNLQGQPETISYAREINVEPNELDVSLIRQQENNPVYPFTDVTVQPVLNNDPILPGLYYGTYSITKVGDPNYYKTIMWSQYGPPLPSQDFQFENEGEYNVSLDLLVNGSSATGYATTVIIVVNAPKFISADVCCGPYTLCKGSEKMFYSVLSPIGSPGVPESKWNPTNLRWRLYDSNGNKLKEKLETFPFDQYSFTHYFTYKFDIEGDYTLRLETWNDQHGYDVNILDPQYVNTFSYYDVEEKKITVTSQMAYLNLIAENSGYYVFDADPHTFSVEISNPGLLNMNWVATAMENASSWCVVSPTSGGPICCNNSASIGISVFKNEVDITRYGTIKIDGTDVHGNQMQPVYIIIEQWGNDGTGSQLIVGNNSNQQFGFSVSVDGYTAVIGSPGKSASDNSSVWIYEKNQIGVWVEKATLIPPPGQKYFGRAVDINGEYVIVSSTQNAAIYKKPQGGWSGNVNPLKILENNFADSEDYGGSVAIWGDYAVVGCKKAYMNVGIALVYFRDFNGIDQWGRQKQIGGNSAGDYFGASVDIYNDLIAVGAPQTGNNNGYINVYNRNKSQSEVWDLEQHIPAPLSGSQQGPNVLFGHVVSIFENRLASVYNSNNGVYYYWDFPLFVRNTFNQWELIDAGFRNNFYNIGKNFNSITLFKDFSRNSPNNQDFYIGGPSLADNAGQAFHSYFESQHSQLVTEYHWCTIDPLPGDRYGHGICKSYHSILESAPGYLDKGCVIFLNIDKKESLCDADIDLSFKNFNKSSGVYEDIIARNINIGGEALPAIFASGSDIRYTGNEIILQDGFQTEYGANFEAGAEICQSTPEAKSNDEATEILSLNVGGINEKSISRINGGSMIEMSDVYKILRNRKKDFLWYQVDIYSDNNSVGFYNKKSEEIKVVMNPSQRLLIDKKMTNGKTNLIFKINDPTGVNFNILDNDEIESSQK